MSLLFLLLAHLNLSICYGIYLWLDRGARHRTFNRGFLLLAPLCALLLPLLTFPANETPLWTSTLAPVVVLKNLSFTPASSTSFHWSMLYLAGTAFFFVRAFRQVLRAATPPLCERIADFRGVAVYSLKEPRAHYSFFRRIYLNPQHHGQADTVLLHEYAHCRGGHSFDLILSAIYRSIFWINPIVWLWERRMRENHEYIADHYVLSHNVDARSYAQVLFEATFDTPAPALAHSFEGKSLLRKRIENLKRKNQHHMKQLLIVPALAGLGFLAMSINAPTPPAAETAHSTAVPSTGQPDKPAEFKGGMEALVQFLSSETRYPASMREKGVTGTVFVKFEVAPGGAIESVSVAQSSGQELLDAEAVRVVQAMPDWNPAESKGKTVRSQMTLPIKFIL